MGGIEIYPSRLEFTMQCKLITPASIEPISLSELKLHLRLDSGSFADNIDETISIAPGSHAVQNNYTIHIGDWIEVIGYSAIVTAQYGIATIGGVVDIKIQETDDKISINDWSGGTFTQVTIGATSSTQEKAYTGIKRYIRTVAKVITQAAEFSTTVIRLVSTSYEDDLLNSIITASREYIEDITSRTLLTQTWEYYPVNWPGRSGYRGTPSREPNLQFTQTNNLSSYYIKLPFGNLQTVTSVKWKDTAGNETTLTENTDYIVETNGDQCGKIVLPWGVVWPTGQLYPSNPITIRFVSGWTTAALVPYKIKVALKMIAADLYEHREKFIEASSRMIIAENVVPDKLLSSVRLWDSFI